MGQTHGGGCRWREGVWVRNQGGKQKKMEPEFSAHGKKKKKENRQFNLLLFLLLISVHLEMKIYTNLSLKMLPKP